LLRQFAELAARIVQTIDPLGPQKQVPAQTSSRCSSLLQANFDDGAVEHSRVEMKDRLEKTE